MENEEKHVFFSTQKRRFEEQFSTFFSAQICVRLMYQDSKSPKIRGSRASISKYKPKYQGRYRFGGVFSA